MSNYIDAYLTHDQFSFLNRVDTLRLKANHSKRIAEELEQKGCILRIPLDVDHVRSTGEFYRVAFSDYGRVAYDNEVMIRRRMAKDDTISSLRWALSIGESPVAFSQVMRILNSAVPDELEFCIAYTETHTTSWNAKNCHQDQADLTRLNRSRARGLRDNPTLRLVRSLEMSMSSPKSIGRISTDHMLLLFEAEFMTNVEVLKAGRFPTMREFERLLECASLGNLRELDVSAIEWNFNYLKRLSKSSCLLRLQRLVLNKVDNFRLKFFETPCRLNPNLEIVAKPG